MRLMVVGLVLGLALVACGDGEENAEGASDSSASTTETVVEPPAPPSPPAVADLKTTCPEVEAALPDYSEDPAYDVVAEEVFRLSAAGDTETQNALQPVIEALRGLATAERGLPYIEADQAYLSSLDGLATRCAAVGSSALQ